MDELFNKINKTKKIKINEWYGTVTLIAGEDIEMGQAVFINPENGKAYQSVKRKVGRPKKDERRLIPFFYSSFLSDAKRDEKVNVSIQGKRRINKDIIINIINKNK